MNKLLAALVIPSMCLLNCGTASPYTDAGTDAGTPTAPTCASYCAAMAKNCTGPNAQYVTEASCLGTCSAFAQGTTGATSGNTLSCRAYHAGASPADAAQHCPHAGPAGDGACGSNCEGFCTVAVAKCATNFADIPSCTTACNGFAMNTAHYTANTSTGNNYACRMYHLSVAATDAASATAHCSHTTTASAPGTCQ